jgi:hypothetical protein
MSGTTKRTLDEMAKLRAEIARLQKAKRGALAMADERSRENVRLRAALAAAQAAGPDWQQGFAAGIEAAASYIEQRDSNDWWCSGPASASQKQCNHTAAIRALRPPAAPAESEVNERTSHQTIPIRVWVDVDVGIAAMVRYLNSIPGVRIHASCQGTTREGGPAPYRPQVMATWTDEVFERLQREFDITIKGENWGYLHPRDKTAPPSASEPAGAPSED